MRKLLLIGLLLAGASVQAQAQIPSPSPGGMVTTTYTVSDPHTAMITFTDGRVSEITYDKKVPVNTYTTVVPGDSTQNITIPIGNMPNTTFDNMALIRLGQTKPQVAGVVGQPDKVTRTINENGVMDVWYYGISN